MDMEEKSKTQFMERFYTALGFGGGLFGLLGIGYGTLNHDGVLIAVSLIAIVGATCLFLAVDLYRKIEVQNDLIVTLRFAYDSHMVQQHGPFRDVIEPAKRE